VLSAVIGLFRGPKLSSNQFPEIQVKLIDGSTFQHKAGQPVIINFWGKQNQFRWFKKNYKNRTAIELNTNPSWILDFNLGASAMDFDLTPYDIKKLNIDMGAASLRLKLGVPKNETRVIINAGASSIKISVPQICQ